MSNNSNTTVTPAKSDRAAIYTRYSTQMAGSVSIEEQVRLCRETAAKKGWIVLDDHIYSDCKLPGCSAPEQRPGFQAMVEAIETSPGLFQRVLTMDSTKLTRSRHGLLHCVEMLSSHGVSVYFVDNQRGSDDLNFLMMEMVTEFLDSQYSAALAKNVRSAKKGRILQGLHAGGRCYGYQSVPLVENRKGRSEVLGYRHIILEPEAQIVRRVFEMYGNRMRISDIAITLNAEGVAGPNNHPWGRTNISRLLQNQRYAGLVLSNKTVEATHLRIVSDVLWKPVQARCRDRRRRERGKSTATPCPD